MADQIGQFDEHEARTMGWHGKTKVDPELTLERSQLVRHEIQPIGLYLPDGSPAIAETNEETGEVSQWSLLGYTDCKLTTGKPFNPATFKPFTNAELVAMIKEAIAGMGAEIESVLTCCNRGKIAVSVKLSDKLATYSIGDRVFEQYLSFLLGRDMGCPLVVKTGNVCVVCANTYAMALASGGKAVNARVKQTKNGRAKIANMLELIDSAVGVQAEFKAAFEQAAQHQVKHSEAKAVFTGFLMPEFDGSTLADSERDEFELPTRTGNRVDRLLELFHDDSKGNLGSTRADLFSAGTDFYSHESAGKDTWKQVQSSEFGSAANEKSRLWAVVSNPELYTETKARGEAILSLC